MALDQATVNSLDALGDEALVARAVGGERAAFDRLAVRHMERLYRFLSRGVANGADVEDATQRALVKAYLKLHTYNPRWRFTTWLFTIGLRELRALRARGSGGPGAVSLERAAEAADPRAGPAAGADEGELWAAARRALTAQQYTALWLRYGEDLPPRDVAKVMRRPSVWVRVTLHRACATLREAVGARAEWADLARGRAVAAAQGRAEERAGERAEGRAKRAAGGVV